MTYKIEFTKSAAKALKKVPLRDRRRIAEEIDGFAENLPDPKKTKMKETIHFTGFE